MSQPAIALIAVLAAWAGVRIAAVLLARFLPDGAVKSAVSVLPSTLTMFQRLMRSKSMPRRVCLILWAGFLYAVSPLTIIPDFVPVVGKVDNVLALILALRWSSRMIATGVLLEAWPGKPSQLKLLVGNRVNEATTPARG